MSDEKTVEPAERCGMRHPYDLPGRLCARVQGHEQPSVWRVPFRIEGSVLIATGTAETAEDVVWRNYLGEDDIANGDLDALLERAEDGLRAEVNGIITEWHG